MAEEIERSTGNKQGFQKGMGTGLTTPHDRGNGEEYRQQARFPEGNLQNET